MQKILRVSLRGGATTSSYYPRTDYLRRRETVSTTISGSHDHHHQDCKPIEQNEKFYILLLFVEDETAMLLQDPAQNCGGYSGKKVLSRQRLKLDSDPMGHLTYRNLMDGNTLDIAGRRYFVEGCDSYTRQYLTLKGVTPPSVVTHFGSTLPRHVEANGILTNPVAWPKTYPLKTYAENVGKVLRFFGEWTNPHPNQGGVTIIFTEKVELRYYLEDGTLELRSHVFNGNTLSDQTKCNPHRILRRTLVPKNLSDVEGVTNIGCRERPVLSFIRSTVNSVMDRHPQALPPPKYLAPEDFILGNSVNVNGRLLRLVECDDFTRHHFKQCFNIDQDSSQYLYNNSTLGCSKPLGKQPLDPVKLECSSKDPLHPLPTSITKNTQFAKPIREGEENVLLRFSAKLTTEETPEDSLRQFVICVYMFDSTVSVYELDRINSGRRAGMFFSRNVIPDHSGEGFLSPHDFFVGATVTIYAHTFEILGSDEFTSSYMERSAHEFREANYDLALTAAKKKLNSYQKLTDICRELTRKDPTTSGLLRVDDALSILSLRLGTGENALSTHQISALCRRHRIKTANPLQKEEIAHLIALYIKKNNSNVRELRLAFENRDLDMVGKLPLAECLSVLKSSKLVTAPFVESLVKSWANASTGEVSYKSLVDAIDPLQRSDIHANLPCSATESAFVSAMQRSIDAIKYGALLKELGLQSELTEPLTTTLETTHKPLRNLALAKTDSY